MGLNNADISAESKARLFEMVFEWGNWDQDMIDEQVFADVNMMINTMQEAVFSLGTASIVTKDTELQELYLSLLTMMTEATSAMTKESDKIRERFLK